MELSLEWRSEREAPIRINETTDRGLHKFSRDFSYTLYLLLFSPFSFYFSFTSSLLSSLLRQSSRVRVGDFYTYLHRDYEVTDVSLAVVTAIEVALGLA